MTGLNMECADTFQGQPLEQVPLHKLQVQNPFYDADVQNVQGTFIVWELCILENKEAHC